MNIYAQNLVKSFTLKSDKRIEVLKNLSLDINSNDFIALMGPSGAGKSTLLHILGSVDLPDKGSVIFKSSNEEYDLFKMNNQKLAHFRNNYIGFIFQQFHLLPEFSSLENIMMPSLIKGDGIKFAKSAAMHLLEKVGMQDRADHKPSELSGGESQRVAIARAMINEPVVIFADEPTGNLDKENSDMILDLLENIKNENNLTLVMATHSDEVAKRADNIIRIADGVIQ